MFSEPRKSVIRRRKGVSGALQAALDGLCIIGVASGLIRFHIGVLTAQYALMLILLLGIVAIVYDQMAIYRSNRSPTLTAWSLLRAWSLSFLVLILIGFVSKQGHYYSRLLLGQLYVLGLAGHLILHLGFYALQKTWFSHHREKGHALVIGQGDLANYLALKINNNPWMGQELVGAVSLGKSHLAEKLEFGSDGLPELGCVDQLASILKEHDIDLAYIVAPLVGSRLLEDVYSTLLDNHVSVHWVPDIFSLRLVNHSVNEIAGIPVLTLSETPLTGTDLLLKTLEDKLLSIIILALISPILLVIAIAIKLDSPGPVFFRQQRTGWNGKNFLIWKFRSMYAQQPETDLLEQAHRDDPRVTRVGAFIRRTSLDELPQLLNVLSGDMSLVGPRPHAIQHDEEYSKRIADYFARHNIKPGITGLAQVRGFRGETLHLSQMIQRIECDIEYINNWSLWLDFIILVRTTRVFTGKYAY